MIDPVFLLDSNICIYATEGANAGLKARLIDQGEGALAISTITLAEIFRGYQTKDQQIGRDALLDAVQILPFDQAAARCFATLPFRRGSFDRLIAAHALSLGLTLVTNNERDFADIPGLKVENWTE